MLCYGYDADTQAAIVYDPNFPDCEVRITEGRSGNDNVIELHADAGATDMRFRAMFEQQELFANRISDRVTYDFPDNVARNLNFAVRPPLVNVQDGWRWCRKCEGLWFPPSRSRELLRGRRSRQRGQRVLPPADELPAIVGPTAVAVVP